jgi:hypothetical protein
MARCLSMLGQLREVPAGNPVVARGVDYLLRTQGKDGSWFGRWRTNYIYGTWSVLCAFSTSTSIADHVAVDSELRGCPINKRCGICPVAYEMSSGRGWLSVAPANDFILASFYGERLATGT